MKKFMKLFSLVVITGSLVFLNACSTPEKKASDKINLVATSTMLTDLAKVIGGDHLEVTGLMEPGVDPHYYQASAGDVKLMQNADVVAHHGLDFEGKLGDVFEQLEKEGKVVINISQNLDQKELLADPESDGFDPHIWWDVELWSECAKELAEKLAEYAPEHAADFKANYDKYHDDLHALEHYIEDQINLIPERSRVLVTAHDAFSYFGRAFGFEVKGLQGISTTSEAGTADVKELADFIVENEIKAIFVESSVPVKNIKALQEAVKAQGFNVEIGGELFSDSLGDKGSTEETYIGTYTENVNTIVGALK